MSLYENKTENEEEIPFKIRVNNGSLETKISTPNDPRYKDDFLHYSKRSNLVHIDMKDERITVTSPLVYLRWNGHHGPDRRDDELYSSVYRFFYSRFSVQGDIRKDEIPYYYASTVNKKDFSEICFEKRPCVWFSGRKILNPKPGGPTHVSIDIIGVFDSTPTFFEELLSAFPEHSVEKKKGYVNVLIGSNCNLRLYLRPFLLSRGYIRYDSPYGGPNSHLGDSIYFKVSDRNLIKFQLFDESDYLLAYIDRLENRIERLEGFLDHNDLNQALNGIIVEQNAVIDQLEKKVLKITSKQRKEIREIKKVLCYAIGVMVCAVAYLLW